MSNIETEVVQLKFDNAQFEAAIRKTLSSLVALNSGLKLEGATKGLNDVSNAASHFNLGKIASGVENISSKFSAMSVVGIAALASITTKAISAGAAFAKSFTIAPITDGLHEYETKLGSIQTILANTQAAGTNLKQVSKTLNELNTYSDQTIYNFGEMAKNIGTFTAAGVDLKTATASIKGIANLAALSGSNSEQASTAMYQLSQAISAGKVSLEDWNSVVNAGLGGTIFQRALAKNAEKMGTLSKGAVELKGKMKNVTIEGESFRESITAKPGEKSWLTSDVLTRTLSQFTGDLSDAALAAQGFNKAEIKAIQSQAKTAKNAATQVKTLSQLLGTLKESAGSGWAQTWEIILGNFDEAKKMFTNINNVLGGFITASANARNKVLGDWKKLGGRTAIIEAIGNSFKALIAFMKPIRDAFREIFPPTTGKQLADLSVSIRNFTRGLTIGAETADKLKRTFAGVFAIIGIGVEIVKQIARTFFGLFGTVSDGSGSFLDVTAKIGDFLVKLHDAIVNGEDLTKFFDKLGNVLAFPIKAFQVLSKVLASVFGKGGASGLSAAKEKLAPLGDLGDKLASVWSKVADALGRMKDAFANAAPALAKISSSIMDAISGVFAGDNFDKILSSLNTGLFAALVVAFRKFASGSLFGDVKVGEGFFGSIRTSFENLTGTMKAMQQQLKAGTLLKIAAAIALLTVSVVALSMIDADKLTKALTAMTVMFGQLLGMMALFAKASAGAGIVKLPVMAAGLILLSIAIGNLVISVIALSKLSWEEIAKGLGTLTFLIGALIFAVRGMAAYGAGMFTAGAGLIRLGAAIKVLASAVKDFGDLSWEQISKGLVGIGSLLVGLALFSKFAGADKGGISSGAGIILLAAGIKILASAMKDISALSWEEIGKGLAGIAVGLGLIAAALILIPPSSILSAAAVLIVATSLGLLADAIGIMGNMSWIEIAKGLVVLAGSLTIIAVAMNAMTTSIAGAAALVIVTGALALLAPVLKTFGGMSWEEIAKGFIVLAGAFAIIGVAGLLLTPVVPVLIAFGGAVALMGLGMLSAGAGMILMAAGISALAVAGTASSLAVVAIVTALVGLIPQVMIQIAKGIQAFTETLASSAPAIFKAMSTVMVSMLTAMRKIVPKIISLLLDLIVTLVQKIAAAVPKFVSAGFQIIRGFLAGIASNIGRIVTMASTIIVNFLNGISKNQGRIIDAGVKLIISFINGMASAIRNNSKAMGAAGANLATAIVQGMAQGLAAGAGVIAAKARDVARGALNAAKSALGIHSPSKEFEKVGKFVNDGFLKGLQGNSSQITDAFNKMKDLIKTMYTDAGADVVRLEDKLKRLTKARHKDNKEIRETKKELAAARSEQERSAAALKTLTKHLDDERDKLKKLANSYDKVTEKLTAAQQKLDDAKKTRDDYKTAITAQYSDLPEINADTKIADYMDQLKEQIVKTKAFAAMLKKLRALGLNDTLYKELLTKGTDAMPFVSQLLDSGQAGVDELNGLDNTLEKTAAGLGKTAAGSLYQDAVDAAQGLVDGLKKQQKAIRKIMEEIAEEMIKAIKKRLKIKSPSRVFAEIGRFSAMGMAQGLQKATSAVTSSVDNVGKEAVLALQKSLSGMDKMGVRSIDITPTIRPVIDLTDVKRGSTAIGDLLRTDGSISVGTTYDQALSARRTYDSNRTLSTQPVATAENVRPIYYTQNNNSPKALSNAEIYRGTRNQLSKVKGALTK